MATQALRGVIGHFLTVGVLLTALDSHAASGRAAMLHFRPVLGQVSQNIEQLESLVQEAFENGADLVIAPELATTGYCVTREGVVQGLGLTDPYPELATIRALAERFGGYVVVGIAEVATSGVFNSAVVYGPTGYLRTQTKRTLPLWNDAGEDPIVPITTPFGDVAVLVCSDTYLPDLSRVATLNGADVIVAPANWWGRNDQEQVWQTRAQENGVWYFVANRWGTEVDERFSPPYTYDMNDAPSVAVDPNGDIRQLHRAENDPVPKDTILYQDFFVPDWRIGNALSQTYTVVAREPSAYGELANLYYRRDLTYAEYPGLPTAGIVRVASMAYRPQSLHNMARIRGSWAAFGGVADVLVLPGLGVTSRPVASSNDHWYLESPWNELQAFVRSNRISLLVTSVVENATSDWLPEALLLVRPNVAPQLIRQVHATLLGPGSGVSPAIVDLEHARVGVLLGRDVLFPEASTHLAKSGVDLLVVSSTVGTAIEGAPFGGINYSSDVPALRRLWRVRSNENFHVAAADWMGAGTIVENGGGYISAVRDADEATPLVTMDLDTQNVRYKYLNAYKNHDLSVLLDE